MPRLVHCILLVAAALAMASGVDAGLTREWPGLAKNLYVLAMLLSIAYAVIGGIDAIAALLGKQTSVPAVTSRGQFRVVAVLSILGVGAKAIESGDGWAFSRSSAVLIGGYVLFLAIASPTWFGAHPTIVAVRAALGTTRMRLCFAAIGVGLILAGVLNWPLTRLVR